MVEDRLELEVKEEIPEQSLEQWTDSQRLVSGMEEETGRHCGRKRDDLESRGRIVEEGSLQS